MIPFMTLLEIAGLASQGLGAFKSWREANDDKQRAIGAARNALNPEQSYDMALRQLNPYYSGQMQDTLDQVNQNLISRGFFGQAPGAGLASQAAGDVESARLSAVASLANQLYGQSRDQANQTAQMWTSMQGNAQNGLQGYLGNIAGMGTTAVSKSIGNENQQIGDAFSGAVNFAKHLLGGQQSPAVQPQAPNFNSMAQQPFTHSPQIGYAPTNTIPLSIW